MDDASTAKAQLRAAVDALPENVTLADAEALLRARLAAATAGVAPAPAPAPPSPSEEPPGALAVRRIRPADAPALARLMGELGYPMDEALAERKIAELAASEPDAAWVAEEGEGGEVVGVVGTHRTWLLHRDGALGRITALVVSAPHRRLGVGRLLMRTAEAHLRRHGCERIELTSGADRHDAHRFYRSLGYEVGSLRFVKGAQPPPGG